MPPEVRKTFAPRASREERRIGAPAEGERRPPRSAAATEEVAAGLVPCATESEEERMGGASPAPTSLRVSQWLELRATLRRRVGGESRLLRTTSMWPSLKRSPKAAPRAQTTEARPLPVAGGTSWNLEPSRLRKS